jgi:hypothetical protein
MCSWLMATLYGSKALQEEVKEYYYTRSHVADQDTKIAVTKTALTKAKQ